MDLFSLSRMFETAGSREQSVETCQRALSGGLPEEIEARALHQLALQYKRQHQHELAVDTWLELTRRASPLALEAYEELAIHYEHHRRDPKGAMEFTLTALERLARGPTLRPARGKPRPYKSTPPGSRTAWRGCKKRSPGSRAPLSFPLPKSRIDT